MALRTCRSTTSPASNSNDLHMRQGRSDSLIPAQPRVYAGRYTGRVALPTDILVHAVCLVTVNSALSRL